MRAGRITGTTRLSIGGVRNQALDSRPPTRIERALGHQRAASIVLLILLPLVCWSWIVVMARDMYGPMTGASAWMMTREWDARHLLLLWAMWAVMMAGMMLPSVAPLLLLYGAAARRRSVDRRASYEIYALAAGYVTMWSLFSVAAVVAQRALSILLILSPMMTLTSPVLGAAVLLLAGIYQMTPLKSVCLRQCQSPMSFLMHRWRPGVRGAFRMGVDHGAYCLGCCWALMALLFVGGVMNLAVIAALTVFVGFEKLSPFGVRTARASGVVMIGAGIWMLLAPRA
jgi:predicted metal-binding membrane protein